MSTAFLRDSENQWLHEIAPTLPALEYFLSRENNFIRIFLTKKYFDPKYQTEIFEMSDGLRYARDEKNSWYVLPD